MKDGLEIFVGKVV